MSRVWITNLGALPIIASVSLTHIPCLFACISESVSCVYVFFSTCLSTCVARAASVVFCCIFITTFLLLFSFSTASIDTYVTVPIDVLIALRICLSSSSSCISIWVIHAYVWVNVYKHFPPLSHSYIQLSLCLYVYMWRLWWNDHSWHEYSNYNTSLCTCW